VQGVRVTTIVNGDYVLPAGQVLSGVGEAALRIEGQDWRNATLNGRVELTNSSYPYSLTAVIATYDTYWGSGGQTLTIGAGGSISATSSNNSFVSAVGVAGSTGSGVKLVNLGSIEVRTSGEAWGVSVSIAGFENQGSLVVNATGSATGVDMHIGGPFINSGTISVTGGSGSFQGATAVRMYQGPLVNAFVNSGTIIAAHVTSSATSVGVITAGYTNIVNTGLIEGDQSIRIVRDGILSDGGRNHLIVNSGTLKGDVYLNPETGEPVVLRNSGVIQGAVTLNLGADTYNGAAGTVTGVVRGHGGADSLLGGSGAETLSGDQGDDTIDGGAGGADRLDGGEGADVLSFAGHAAGVRLDIAAQTVSNGMTFTGFERYVGSDRDDTLLGSASADTIAAGLGADTVNGAAGGDSISDAGGANYLRGEDGDDRITGGADFDDINGNMGADTASGGAGEDWVVGGKDNDLLFGDAAYDIVYGNLGADTCEGGDGNDIVRGGQDNDLVRGGAGDDYLSGDRGDDTVTGGVGADVFHSFGEAGLDRVTDFNYAQGDRVRLDPGSEYTLEMVGFDTVINIVGGARIVLVDVSYPQLPSGWLFVG